ncbi:cyanoexosortase A system-associated protein [Leptolyngbya sp. AN03gr2]|uniref:cyanoexosortase A system-associated protein n=1 Tax=unclassified Leptolyngbya TaxID=2650499 RepID=UPI003D320F42
MKNDRFKFIYVCVLTAGTIAVLIKAHFYPNKPTKTAFEIPQTLNLPNWSFKSSSAINDNQSNFQSGKTYQYQQNQNTIDIEIRHIVNTDGDVRDYLQVYQAIALTQAPITQNKNGFYGLFTHQNRTYLSTCINPKGESTFTGVQFARNRNLYDIRLDRIALWLFSSTSLRDERCLWVQLSTTNSDRELLEKVWLQIYPTLRDRFSV